MCKTWIASRIADSVWNFTDFLTAAALNYNKENWKMWSNCHILIGYLHVNICKGHLSHLTLRILRFLAAHGAQMK